MTTQGCIHPGCENRGRYESQKGLVCALHLPEPTAFNGVKVFCATKASDRDMLGEKVTEWLREHPTYSVIDKVVTQSSDNAYHAISITLFYHD